MQEERWIIVMSAWQSQENSRLPYYAMVGICSNHRSKKNEWRGCTQRSKVRIRMQRSSAQRSFKPCNYPLLPYDAMRETQWT